MNDEEFSRELDLSPMRSAAVQLHELFDSLQQSGFTRKEALYMVTRVLVSNLSSRE